MASYSKIPTWEAVGLAPEYVFSLSTVFLEVGTLTGVGNCCWYSSGVGELCS